MFGESGAVEGAGVLDRAPVAEPTSPIARSRKDHYAPGLDGVRGVAVAAIVLYHLGLIDGGLLSVSVFFTLSGYLITSILLSSWGKSGSIDLKVFWLRRARRLLPALLMLLGVVLLAAKIARPAKLAMYSHQALSALVYMANWATIARGDTYFNRFTGPGPYDHLWSLAIEEQFYALWPLLVFGLLVIGRRLFAPRGSKADSARSRVVLIVVTVLLGVASAFAMARLYDPNGLNNTRAYEGTDARAAPILVGALTAMFLPLGKIGDGGRFRRIFLDIVGVIACAIVVKVVLSTDEYSPFLYRGGESVVSIASAILVLSAGHPKTLVGKFFGLFPFRWLGVRTYGVYLWHMPIVAFMPATLLEGKPLARTALQLVLTLVLAALSWTLLEDPIRREGVVATFIKSTRRVAAMRWAGALILIPIATAAIGVWPLLSHGATQEEEVEALIADLEKDAPEPRPIELAAVASAAPSGSVDSAGVAMPPKPLLTSCTHLVHVGDSTSLGLMSARYIPDAADRLDAQYGAVGVQLFVPEISGGRSIVEKLNGHPSAYEVVSTKKATGYKGCYVLALGNGDGANIRGNLEGLSQRIDWMMKVADGSPVMWTTVKTLLDKGPYQNSYLVSWNTALVQACARHPNMRVFDWASEVQDDWYLPDKIHPNNLGAKEKSAHLAKALAVAFPKDGASPAECLVRSGL